MPKLTYEYIKRPENKERYIISFKSETCRGSVLGYPNISAYCSEDELINMLPSLLKFLEDESVAYYIYDFDDDRYVEYSKNNDPHADGNFNLIYKLNDVEFVNIVGERFKVNGYYKYII